MTTVLKEIYAQITTGFNDAVDQWIQYIIQWKSQSVHPVFNEMSIQITQYDI